MNLYLSLNVLYRFEDTYKLYEKFAMDSVYKTDKFQQFYKGASYLEETTIEEQKNLFY